MCVLKIMYILLLWMQCPIYIIKPIWCSVSVKGSISLLIFCLHDLSIDVSEILKISYQFCVTVNFFFYVC